jgi:asparagine synthase (glutamine-hydrolysing)
MRIAVAVLDKRGGNATSTIAEALGKVTSESETPGFLATPTEAANSPTALGTASTSQTEGLQPQQLKNAVMVFDGRIYWPKLKTNAADFAAEKLQSDLARGAETIVKSVEGDFVMLAAEANRVVACRDAVGVQPLYYGETPAIVALASNRRTLWQLGIAEPKSFPPGNVAIATREGFEFKPVKVLEFCESEPISMEDAASNLLKLLEQSVKMRVADQKRVAVAFSGGLDSSVVACLAKCCGVEVQLIHVSLVDQHETEEARKAAETLGLHLQVHLYTEADVENVLPKVVELIEEPDPIKAAVGVPFFWCAQKAAEAGFKVMLAGQGADELFGGYQRYVTEYLLKGDEAVRKTMFRDVTFIHESNVERDEKICGYHDVELRIPFGSFKVAELAMSLPTELKFESKADSVRKLALRRVAENLGLPPEIALKPKRAVQYSTGINNALKRIAKRHELTLGEYMNSIFLELRKKN